MGAFPADAKQIFTYLTSVGYSPIAAAGILGNIGQEGPAGPESQGTGGGGLIGWTPESSAFPIQPIITGNKTRDLRVQLTDLVAWGRRNGAGPAAMNAASNTPSNAAAFWEIHAERAGIVAMGERQRIANQVYAAAKSGNWPTSGSAPPPGGGTGSDFTAGIFGNLFNPFLKSLGIATNPATGNPSFGDFFERAGLVLVGIILLFIGLMQISHGGSYANAVKSGIPGGKTGKGSSSRKAASGGSHKQSGPTAKQVAADKAGTERMESRAERRGEKAVEKHGPVGRQMSKEELEDTFPDEEPEEVPF